MIRSIIIAFVWSLLESIIWPIPIAILLISMVVLNPEYWWLYGITVTMGSVTGAVIAYILGKNLKDLIVYSEKFHNLRKIIGLDPKKIEEVKNFYNKYGDYFIIIAAISPIPYKLVTWVSGILEYNLTKFIILSIIARGVTFISMAYGASIFGENILDYLAPFKDKFEILIIVIILLFVIIKYYKK